MVKVILMLKFCFKIFSVYIWMTLMANVYEQNILTTVFKML